MQALDKKDREILYQLDLDARQSNSQIARKVRLSKEVVGYRIKRMADEGIIEGFYALVDITKLGYLNGRIFFKLKNISPEEESALYRFFKGHKSFWWVCSISGSSVDLGIACWAKGVVDFQRLKEEILNPYRAKVESYRDSIYSAFHVWRKHYLSPKDAHKSYSLIPGDGEKAEFDAYDLELLSAVSNDARISLVALAQKAGLSITTAKYRLQKLQRSKVILGFRPKINLAKIGYFWYKVEFQLEDNSKKKALLAYFHSHPNIVYAYESIGGGTELEMEMEVESHGKFREIVDGIRANFKDAIRTYNYYLWSNEHKIVFFPSEEFFAGKK